MKLISFNIMHFLVLCWKFPLYVANSPLPIKMLDSIQNMTKAFPSKHCKLQAYIITIKMIKSIQNKANYHTGTNSKQNQTRYTPAISLAVSLSQLHHLAPINFSLTLSLLFLFHKTFSLSLDCDEFFFRHSERRPQIFIPKRKSTSIVIKLAT